MALAGKTFQSIAFVAVKATDPNATGRTSLTFQVGAAPEPARAPIEVGTR
ncbi:hypothetical protein [Streptomyces flaveolus]